MDLLKLLLIVKKGEKMTEKMHDELIDEAVELVRSCSFKELWKMVEWSGGTRREILEDDVENCLLNWPSKSLCKFFKKFHPDLKKHDSKRKNTKS